MIADKKERRLIMKKIYESNIQIEYTNVGRDLKLTVVQAADLIQNIVTDFFRINRIR